MTSTRPAKTTRTTRSSRTAAAGRAAATSKETPLVNGLDLDELIAAGPGVEPYRFSLGGQEFTATHPHWVDWRDAAELDPDDLQAVLRLYLGEDQLEQFRDHRVPSDAVRRLVRDIERHYLGDGTAES